MSYDITDWNETGSINLAEHEGDILIEMYSYGDDDEDNPAHPGRCNIQLQFTADQAREIYDRLGHLLYGLSYKD